MRANTEEWRAFKFLNTHVFLLAIFNDLQNTSRNTKAFKHYQIHPHTLENNINRSNNSDKLYQCRLLTKKKKKDFVEQCNLRYSFYCMCACKRHFLSANKKKENILN